MHHATFGYFISWWALV